jgi:DNA-binding MarR family transcriptional regulator
VSADARLASRSEVISELHQAVGEMLGAERRMRSRDRVTDDGLTISQIRALMGLKTKPEATVGDLAKFADVTPATMTVILDQLDAAGIVVRTRSPHDRRVVLVSLTERGQAFVAKRRRRWEATWRDVFADLSDDELRAAITAMRRIAGIFDSVAER